VIVARHEVPGTALPQESLPVGHGLIRAGVRRFDAFLKNPAHISTRNTSGISCARSYRTLRDGSFEDAFPGTSCQATIGVVPTGRSCRHFATASNSSRAKAWISPEC
jgi:hypothetical protein